MGVTKDITKAGDGQTMPKAGDKLHMHYTGTLKSDGSKFDSSRDKVRPATSDASVAFSTR